MTRRSKKTYPGSVQKKGNALYLVIRGRWISTGLRDSPEGRLRARELLRQHWEERRGYESDSAPEAFGAVLLRFGAKKGWRWNGNKYLPIEGREQEISAKSMNGYRRAFVRIIPPADMDRPPGIRRIKAAVERFAGRKNISAGTRNSYIRQLQTLVNFWAAENNLGQVSLYKQYRRRRRKQPKKIYTPEALASLLTVLDNTDPEFADLIRFLALTGGRISETLRLQRADVRGNTLRFDSRKNQEENELPITPAMRDVLHRQLSRRYGAVQLWRWKETSHSRLLRHLKAACKKARIECLGFHAIRATFSTALFEQNLSITAVKDLMRHKSIATTYSHYRRYQAGQHAETLEKAQEAQPLVQPPQKNPHKA